MSSSDITEGGRIWQNKSKKEEAAEEEFRELGVSCIEKAEKSVQQSFAPV